MLIFASEDKVIDYTYRNYKPIRVSIDQSLFYTVYKLAPDT